MAKSSMHRGWRWNHQNNQLHLVVNGITALVYGNYGDEKLQSATNTFGCRLGTKMVLPDNRTFRLAQAGSISNLQPLYAVAADMDFKTSAVAAEEAAVGAYRVKVTAGEDLSANDLQDGILAVTGGNGRYPMYRIKEHPAITSGATGYITLHEPVVLGKTGVSGITTSDTVTLYPNPYKGVRSIRWEYVYTVPQGYPAMSKYHAWVGVPTRTPNITAEYYCWIQVGGICHVSGYDNFGAAVNERVAYWHQDGSIKLYTADVFTQVAGIVVPTTYFSASAHDIPGAIIPISLMFEHSV